VLQQPKRTLISHEQARFRGPPHFLASMKRYGPDALNRSTAILAEQTPHLATSSRKFGASSSALTNPSDRSRFRENPRLGKDSSKVQPVMVFYAP
jgi:hypothetical protein